MDVPKKETFQDVVDRVVRESLWMVNLLSVRDEFFRNSISDISFEDIRTYIRRKGGPSWIEQPDMYVEVLLHNDCNHLMFVRHCGHIDWTEPPGNVVRSRGWIFNHRDREVDHHNHLITGLGQLSDLTEQLIRQAQQERDKRVNTLRRQERMADADRESVAR